jgi:hypothetical protein
MLKGVSDMEKRPSVFKIMTIDYVALLAATFPVAFWGMYGLLLALQSDQISHTTYPMIAAVVTFISVLVFIWRILLFFKIFGDGLETPATISNVSFFRDRGRVDYAYTHQGQKYASGNMVHKVRSTKNIKVGDKVILMVDRNKPKRAYIRDMYI